MQNNQDNLFTKQFVGQCSYGHQDMMDHMDQLPIELKNNTNHILQKPQELFSDKIDNFDEISSLPKSVEKNDFLNDNLANSLKSISQPPIAKNDSE